MHQVADWLEKLGFGQYAQRFAENDISFAVLPDLTDQDLKEIGLSLGHRRQLLRAIAELTGREKDTVAENRPRVSPLPWLSCRAAVKVWTRLATPIAKPKHGW
jgi:SAM domain (Sterile alpha motif)